MEIEWLEKGVKSRGFFFLIMGEIRGCLSVYGNHLIKRDDVEDVRENSIAGEIFLINKKGENTISQVDGSALERNMSSSWW